MSDNTNNNTHTNTNANDITIAIKTAYIEEHSQPQHQRFVFAYTITIGNNGLTTAQLLSRHWIITDTKNAVQEVQGDGVIGEQPQIRPGESFTYSSNAILETGAGTMEGSYTMKANDETEFTVAIPLFSLTRPHSLH